MMSSSAIPLNELIDPQLTQESCHWDYVQLMNKCYKIATTGEEIEEISALPLELNKDQLQDVCTQLYNFVSVVCPFYVPKLDEFLSEKYKRTLSYLDSLAVGHQN